MKNRFSLFTFISFLLVTSGCTSAPPVWQGRGTSSLVSPNTEDRPINIQEGLNVYDYRMLIAAALEKLASCKAPRNLPHMISNFENQTSSDLDLPLLKRELSDILHESHYSIVDKASRPEVAEEYSYEANSDFTIPSQAIRKESQVGIFFLIRTVINSRSQQTADEKFTRYRLSLQIVNAETNEVSCVGSAEIKKEYERKRVAL